MGQNLENLTLTGTANTIGRGNAFDNVVLGGSGANLLQGLAGNDVLKGSTGNDITQGGAGDDTLSESAGQNLLDGGAGNDTLTGNSGDELFIGGVGNDLIGTGSGADMIAFNQGDGQDTVTASTAPDNTLTLGGGIAYADLAFRKSGNDLVLDTGQGESIALQNWYLRSNYRHVVNLQMVAEAMANFSPGGTDPLRDNKVEQFNLTGLVDRFDQARAATPGLTDWALTNALLEFHIGGSDTAAIGGDLAYQYGKNKNFSNVSLAPAQAILGNTNFGSGAQTLQPLASLQDSSPRLG